ncbi:unnamed protein product [Sordaria macrospora k-hell]|uniref:WGS project CABT00000000 data, contig 2.84 n=1 Tax=Sordaria macrospora (strain ATCC MYA-333 / DSM 997 / K(L3346) / K-hell) TaxID=771870 RepID=F7WBT7_SORMK|nr:uncharacterized protein SMAC_09322 [Sordaria macrospora k-hell]CCC14480.1 unnamed protein product [Sordaria macrospora k-hell]
MPRPHYTTFSASDGALLTFISSLPITSPDPNFIPTSPILTFSGPTGTKTSGAAPTGTVDNSASGKAGNRARSASKASVIAGEGPNYSRLILLLHGFSGSSEYFDRNWEELSKNHWVVAWDMRGHGRSGLRKRRPGVEYDAEEGGDDGEEEGDEEGDAEKANERERDLNAERNAGKRDEGTEGQPKTTKGSEGVKGGKTGRNNNDKRYDTYSGGYHVARLATDLHNLLSFLKTSRLSSSPYNPNNSITSPQPPLETVAIGCSIGAAILQSYIELFTDSAFSGLIFVDQAPSKTVPPSVSTVPGTLAKLIKAAMTSAQCWARRRHGTTSLTQRNGTIPILRLSTSAWVTDTALSLPTESPTNKNSRTKTFLQESQRSVPRGNG